MSTAIAITETEAKASVSATSENFSEENQAVTPEIFPGVPEQQEVLEFQVGQRVHGTTAKAKEWGPGTVVKVSGDKIVVQFDDKERMIQTRYLELVPDTTGPAISLDEIGMPEPLDVQPTPDLLTHLEQQSEAAIAAKVVDLEKELMDALGQVSFFETRRLEYRIKAGRLLNKLQGIIEEHEGYGTWESRCRDTYKIEPRTARNYMRDAREADNPAPAMTENNSDVEMVDPYSDQVKEAIAEEKARREERRREGEASSGGTVKVHLTLNVTKDEMQLFKAATKLDPTRTRNILHAAFLEIIQSPADSGTELENMPEDAVENPTYPDQFEVPLIKTRKRIALLPFDDQPTILNNCLPSTTGSQPEVPNVTA